MPDLPVASASLNAVKHGRMQVMQQTVQFSKQLHKPCCHFPIVIAARSLHHNKYRFHSFGQNI